MSYRAWHVVLSGFILCNNLPLLAETLEWPAWRGAQSGGSTMTGAIPVRFGPDKSLWNQALPGRGCSTPILSGGKIFVTCPIDGRDGLLCFDMQGRKQWQTVFGDEVAGKHRNGSGSNASPVTDGQSIFVYYKSGTLAAVDRDGTIRWQTNLVERFGPVTLFWDHGTSPVLTRDHVVMARMHKGESWLAAFSKQTGKLDWKVARNYETPVECDHGYTTPLVIGSQRQSLLVWGAQHLTLHDARDGRVTWSCGGFNPEAQKLWPAIASPVIIGDMVIVAYGRNDRGNPRLHGVRLGGTGDVTKTAHVWKRDDIGTFVPSPIAWKEQVVLVGDQGKVAGLDPQNGRTIWQGAFPRNRAKFYASPIIAGDRLVAPREDGVVFVAGVADGKFELLGENDMKESVIGSPVPVRDRLVLRGERHLFCFGKP